MHADLARRGICRGWDGWPPVNDHAETGSVDSRRSHVPGLEPRGASTTQHQLLWSATQTVEQAERSPPISGYSVGLGLGSISSSGLTLGAAHFGVLSALQSEGGFVLELIGADSLPGGLIVDLQAQSGSRVAHLSTCDSIHSSSEVGTRFHWTDTQLNWKSAERTTISIFRPSAADQAHAPGQSAADANPLARFEGVPARHDGEAFSITLRLLERTDKNVSLSNAGTLVVSAGAVTKVERFAEGGSRWRVHVRPDGRRSVGIRWMANPRCHKADQSCLPDRVTASAPPEVVIPGPPITARVLELPEYHSGLTRVSFQIEFSEPLFTDLRDLSKRALQVGGAALDGVRRPDDRYDLLEVALAPRSGDDVTIELSRGRSCADRNRICLDDMPRLSDPLKLTIPAATIYLTFDDGPHPSYTPQILDTLADYNARATFFVIGCSAQAFPNLIQRIVREGHTLANHTWNHDVLAGLTRESFEETVTRAQQVLGEHATRCLRPPNLQVDEHTKPWAAELGLRLIMATSVTDDWLRPGADVIASRLLAAARPDAIIVLHDGGGDRSQTVEGLRTALQSLKSRNYSYEPICDP